MTKTDAAENQAAHNLQRIRDVKARYEAELLKKANVVAVGIGIPYRDGRPAGGPSIIVSVTHKIEAAKLALQDLVPEELEDIPVWVEEIGLPRVEQENQSNHE